MKSMYWCDTCTFSHSDECPSINRFIGDWANERVIREITSEIGCASHSDFKNSKFQTKIRCQYCTNPAKYQGWAGDPKGLMRLTNVCEEHCNKLLGKTEGIKNEQ